MGCQFIVDRLRLVKEGIDVKDLKEMVSQISAEKGGKNNGYS